MYQFIFGICTLTWKAKYSLLNFHLFPRQKLPSSHAVLPNPWPNLECLNTIRSIIHDHENQSFSEQISAMPWFRIIIHALNCWNLYYWYGIVMIEPWSGLYLRMVSTDIISLKKMYSKPGKFTTWNFREFGGQIYGLTFSGPEISFTFFKLANITQWVEIIHNMDICSDLFYCPVNYLCNLR